ncbi:MAG: delta-60 repeat domain-containing protein, partial [Chthoniobacterales bacterium]
GAFSTLAPNGGATVTRNHVARLEIDGRLDRTLDLGPAAGGFVAAATVQPDGKILIGGGFTSILGVTRHNIARLNTDGTLDLTFNPDANSAVWSIVVQADGKILIGGFFTSIGGQPRNRIARLDGTTGLADSFDPNANDRVYAIAVQPDGKILVGGYFTMMGVNPRSRIARLDPTTGLADSFDPNPNNSVMSIGLQADGKILVGGLFTSIGGQLRHYMVRLDAATGLADSFNPDPNSGILSIAVQGDGRILLGGHFDTIGGQLRNHMARIDGATGLADSFDPNANNIVFAIVVQADSKILAGGPFTSIGGQPRNYLARLNATSGVADSFDPSPNDYVLSLAMQPDGKILAGGAFTSIGGQLHNSFARLTNDTAALQTLAVTQTAVSWMRDGSSPQLAGVTFELSTDNTTYALLGDGTPDDSSWTLTGLNLPTGNNLYIRARGHYRGGHDNGSENITESVRNAFLTEPTGTPTPSPTPSSTPTPNPTPSPTPSPTPVPSSTPTPPKVTPTPSPSATPSPFPSGTPTPTPTASPTSTPAPSATPTPTPTPTSGSLGNISTRVRVLSGDNVLIGGMIVTGTANKKVIIRAIGPSLTDFGVSGALQDPALELYQGSTLVSSNDDWRLSPQQAEIQNSGLAPTKDAESAIIATLIPNQNYTAIVRGKDGSIGVGIVEAFDLDQGAASKLGNISTRGFVDVDENVMIAGLIVTSGNGTGTKVLVRALGPTLGDFGVPNALANPTLDLVNSSGTVIRSNNDWKDDSQQRALIEAAGMAPTHDVEATLVETVAPGQYTAVVRGSGRTTGVGLVEAYNIQ